MPMSINPIDLAAAAEGILNTQYLLQRERLLSASAQASRLLLEAPDAMKAMPEVLRLLGEAAQVDRTALAFAEIGRRQQIADGENSGEGRADLVRERRQRRFDHAGYFDRGDRLAARLGRSNLRSAFFRLPPFGRPCRAL